MNIILNGQVHPVKQARTVAELMTELGHANKRIAVEKNGQIVPKSEHATTPIQENDKLEIVVAVGGG